ncbi:hypothetical protein AB0L56_30855 [Streptomyces sp. NPDC052079]|uniref:hypothetical protein n=1 Tax=Streptomyces sp. NPDC052079 TaxID=3155526 RepID=UPI00343D9242
MGRPVGEGGLHSPNTGPTVPGDGLPAGLGELGALGAPVVGVRDAGDVAGPVQLLHRAGDVRGFHAQRAAGFSGRICSASAIFRSGATAARSSGTPATAVSRSCRRARALR